MANLKKIGAFIPVRLGSTRLPKKHLKSIQGRPILHHLLDRVFASKYLTPEQVVVCTTLEPEDDELIPIVEQTGARVFRGAKDDIIKRFYDALSQYPFEVIAQIDGDDPCIETAYLDYCIASILEDESIDIALSEGLPLGIASKVFRKEALITVHQAYCSEKNDTGFIWYFTKTGLCRVKSIGPRSHQDVHLAARLTLDYLEDLKFFEVLFKRLYQPEKIFNLQDIVGLLNREPELLNINSALNTEYYARTQTLAKLAFRHNGEIKLVE